MSVKVMGQVWDADLPRPEKFVLLSYADHAAHDGTGIYPSVGRMAWKTGYTDRSIQTITKRLIKQGILVPDGKMSDGRNRYRLDATKLPKRPPYGGENSSPPEKSSGEGVKKTAPGGENSSPKPSCNRHDKPSHVGASSDAHPPPCFPELFDTPIREIKEMKFTRSQWEEVLAAERSRDGDTRCERTRTTLVDWLDRKLNGSGHPAIQTYHDEMDRYPRRNQFDEIIGKVGTNGNLDLWRRIVRAWKMHGWNPYNVAGMLECFEDGRIPSTGGRNGNARRPSGSNGRGSTYTRDDLDAAVEEARGEIDNLTEEERAIIESKSG
jgi:hypothetical protein